MFNFFSSAERLRNKTFNHLEKYSRPTLDFFLLTAVSSAIISIGLILDNASVIIGGMVVAPLITPIFGFSLYLIVFNIKGLFRTLWSIFLGMLLAIATAFIIGHFTSIVYNDTFTTTYEIISRTKPDLLYFLVALLSGMVGSYAYARQNLSEKIVGIAISAAIVPPLSVVGLSLAQTNTTFTISSLTLFLINLAGICLGSILMFIFLGFGKEKENKS
ncbi:MAG: TIGR00341 family protein [Candidatus Magasanikbacteria bacterium CG_4_10_14_0_2_um_filter_33_14]|uniref:TIGR00341 family protein n=1 Tax=Candidatus Magasanikbacteria bacterium CG_4_10_14_0_2_um_filter_33_14 TaxID=1974636 RepID=A0A2M7VB36_9BACT|nr:MAG: TIGR00341 family protein [Candidatus Magasanikbacteria bacterium CG_4_10_14_0_2_um_filter_33_14]